MDVRALKNILEKLNDDDEVIMAKDEEGNNFSPLADFTLELYVPESNWSGSVYIRKLTSKLRQQGFTEEDLYEGKDAVKAVVLWPTN